ncbi:HAD family hydrolase [Helicobacter trogontum]|uniref:HAD family hydrolase n=1 Tax=Helicobacter trogontum TaxID=50960 RepID=UPI000CF088D0|nr:HAD family hydrolase [Helicobacter trogontum]
MDIAFFDFDGTITRGDSFRLFLRFVLGKRFYIKMLENLPTLVGYKLGLIDNSRAKENVLKSCFKGMDQEVLNNYCAKFTEILESFCKDSALQKMRWHKENNHVIVLVSASFEEYLRPLCQHWNIDLLGTTMEVKEGRLTGNFLQPNCYGPEKERRIKEQYDLTQYERIYVYGDTKGDKEMLSLASPSLAFFRVFH